MPGLRFAWRTSNPEVAVVDSNGVVTPLTTGTVEIRASADKVGTAELVILPATDTVLVQPRVDTVLVGDPMTPRRDTARLSARAFDQAGVVVTGVRYLWSSSANGVVTVDSAGLVRAASPGAVTISATSAGKTGSATVVALEAVATLTLAPAVDSIYVDEPIAGRDTIRVVPTARDPYSGLLSNVPYQWLSSSPAVATTDATGLVRAQTLGVTTVSAAVGSRVAASTIHVVPVVAVVEVSSPVTQVLALDTVQLSAIAKGYDGGLMSRTFSWTSSDPAVASVDATGRVIFVAAGQATFTARSAFRTAAVTITALERRLLAITAGEEYTCGVTPLGRGYCWGQTSDGRTGVGADSTCFAATPGPVAGCILLPKRMDRPDISFVQLSVGRDFGCGLATDTFLYCWGNGDLGQIGNGRIGIASAPTLATVKQERFARVSAGAAHACAINITGIGYCWGDDAFGQLGDRRRNHSTTPIPVSDTTLQFKAIAAGGRHTCALTMAGMAYCWGDGAQGQLGNGSTAVMDTPTPVATALSFVAITAGESHTCAIDTTGFAHCWGDNSRGQLGNPALGPQRATPGAVSGSNQFTAISAGAHHTCGIESGLATCWGGSDFGEVGDGSEPVHNVMTPTPVSGNFMASAIEAGYNHTCAISSVNQLTWCWGSNRFGTLGNEYQAAVRATPQLVARPR